MTEIIRKPLSRYPLPDNLNELDTPHPQVSEKRYARINPFQEGYLVSSGEDPTRISPPVSPSDILNKLR